MREKRAAVKERYLPEAIRLCYADWMDKWLSIYHRQNRAFDIHDIDFMKGAYKHERALTIVLPGWGTPKRALSFARMIAENFFSFGQKEQSNNC